MNDQGGKSLSEATWMTPADLTEAGRRSAGDADWAGDSDCAGDADWTGDGDCAGDADCATEAAGDGTMVSLGLGVAPPDVHPTTPMAIADIASARITEAGPTCRAFRSLS
jgi:hypothetical protein